ncbi:papilin isoform X1 [Neoarius graeffei]|uniref:papilin isoform X1 n=1 Tax=Neoarius graeffei TaxID=443677 RepID=UPI00298CB6C3|nr:papilin isoform X1 [Neoarius graeffei]XP_060790680.1 papilin isoform X1 [Neoarius graeffei]
MKLLLAVASMQMLLAPVFMMPSTDYWAEWGSYGECSRSCGIGVTVRMRRCVSQRTDGGHSCVGPDKSYRTCNIQDCPEGSRDFREEQCSQFDGTDFHGKYYKWLAYYGAENQCELNCIPKGENFYFRHRSSVMDGTPCQPGKRDICVEGVCRRLGCDSMLDSGQQEDACLQCGGNGQSCHFIRNTFTMQALPNGYNQMFIIPVGATSIRITENVPTRNYLAVKNVRGEYYLNGHWVIESSRSTPISGTMLYYQRGAEGEMSPETITGSGPTTEPLVIELITQEPNQGIQYEYYLPNSHPREGYYWSYGSWSACSKECGSGYQSRLVFCTVDNEAYPDYLCASLPRPLNNQTCNDQPCPQTRRLAYVYPPQIWTTKEERHVYDQVYSWKASEWNRCSVTCGGGTQVRRVECISHDVSGRRLVEDSLCEAYTPRPVSQQTCNVQHCAQYSVSSWSQCSVTCGSGEQTRQVMCVGSAGGNHVADYMCASLHKPPSTQTCEMPVCLTRIGWHIGDWGLCSKSCSSGLRERQVICSDSQRHIYGVEHCNAYPKPSTVESCNTQPCYSPQVVPSMQDPRGYENTIVGFYPYNPEDTTTVNQWDVPYCHQTAFGCCHDGVTPASGPHGQGCYQTSSCAHTRYGCCQDSVTQAHGPNKEGCPEYVSLVPASGHEVCSRSTYGCCFDGVTAARGANGEGCPVPPSRNQRAPCDLPHTAGLCDDWTARYYYDPVSSRCAHFWYGGCHGNSNNFATMEECQQTCLSQRPVSTSSSTVWSQIWPGANKSQHSHRRWVQTVGRRPAPRDVQASSPNNSWPAVGVSIDKSDPSTVEGIVGQWVVLPCNVNPPPSSTVTVEWRKDGVLLDPSRHIQQPNGSLFMGPVRIKDSGWLLCVATRDRERDHRYIYLSVSDRAGEPDSADSIVSPRFSIDRSESTLVNARAGQSARLHCTILPSSAANSVIIQWTKNGAILNTLRHSQHSDGTLAINNLTAEDSGVYTCTASSRQQLEQLQIQLRVSGDLRITKAPSNVQVSQGSVVRLPCIASGENVNIAWSRNGVPVRPDGHRVQVSADGTLTLYNVGAVDEGSYTCNAYAGTHAVSATAEIRVTKDPDGGQSLSPDCVDEPELANCLLIVSARLCGHKYYSSFCCASCYNYSIGKGRHGRHG